MNARAQVDAPARTSLFTRVSTWGALGGALVFGLYQVVGAFAWLALIVAAVGDYWVGSHRPGPGRAGLVALLIVLSSFATVVVISVFVGAWFGF
jgi:hypothetical protein